MNMRWVKLGCNLLTTLMANPDGVRYLGNDDELLPQIVKSFDQLHPVSSHRKVVCCMISDLSLVSWHFDGCGAYLFKETI